MLRVGASPGVRDEPGPAGADQPPVEPAGGGVPTWVFWSFGLLLLAPIWIPQYLPTEDGLPHLYWVEVYRSLGDPTSPAHRFFVRHLDWTAPHHLLHFGLQYLLASVLEPHVAQKVVISITILTWVAALGWLGKRSRSAVTPGAFLALLLILSSWLYNGFFAFLGAVPFALVTIGLLRGLSDGSIAGRWPYIAIGCLALAAHFAHFFVGALVLLIGGFWVIYPWRPPRFDRLRLVLALAPTGILAMIYLTRGTLGTGAPRWEPLVRVLARVFGLAFFRGFASWTPSFLLALTGFGLVTAFVCWRGLREVHRHGGSPGQRAAILLALLVMAASLAAPVRVGDAWPFNARLHFVALAWLLPIMSFPLSTRQRQGFVTAVSLLLAWQLVTFTTRAVRFSRAYERVIHQASTIPQHATVASRLDYSRARYEHSLVHVLAGLPEDIAQRRHALLLHSFFPRYAYYWVRPRAPNDEMNEVPDFWLDLSQDRAGNLDLVLDPGPSR
jgi:hypothetical protein